MYFDDLTSETAAARQALITQPLIQRALTGNVTRAQYLEFLKQAYHHVRHTVPLLMACGLRIDQSRSWLRDAIIHYIDEEVGHEDWILQDIEHAGGDAAAVRNSQPSHATDVMVAYAYDGVQRRNPLIFFGMGFVLEGTSVQLATRAADQLMTALDLPPKAFTYLTSHGEIDREHTKDFESLVNRFDDAQDRTDVTQAANSFYRLYADVFGEIERVVA
jgi:pyrroloquinoline quinone (PQQ) biosynthesis protein C